MGATVLGRCWCPPCFERAGHDYNDNLDSILYNSVPLNVKTNFGCLIASCLSICLMMLSSVHQALAALAALSPTFTTSATSPPSSLPLPLLPLPPRLTVDSALEVVEEELGPLTATSRSNSRIRALSASFSFLTISSSARAWTASS